MKAFKTTMLPHHPFGILGKPLMSRDAQNGFVMQEFLNVDFFHLKLSEIFIVKKETWMHS
jgi:hypothetical protein